MSFDRFATTMIALGAGIGLAATTMVPTSARVPEASHPAAKAGAYPEITAVTYESYPIATVPLFNRAPVHLASWEKPWLEPQERDHAAPLPRQDRYDAYDDEHGGYDSRHERPDPQVVEDYEDEPSQIIPVDDAEPPADRPIALSMTDHP